jgi:PAS domain-containing protein
MNNAEQRAQSERADRLFCEGENTLHQHTDRLFAALMVIQWLGGIAAALFISPRTWIGETSHVDLHVWAALFLGGAIATLPVYLAWKHPGKRSTRHVIAVAQMLFSALLIHLTGGRLETHFHIFGSLAFLAFYRDRNVLISATIVVALDHFLRGAFWPQSVFGVVTGTNWRWIEHAAWVLFEDVFLIISLRQSLKETHALAERQAALEQTNAQIELRVTERTAELTSEICEREKAEQASRESQRLYHSLVEQLPICVYRRNAEGRLVFVNSRFEKITGLTESAPTNDENSQHESIMRTGKSIESEIRYPQGDGTSLSFQTVKMPVFNDAGHAVQVIAPQRQQVMELERDGLQNVQTVSAFLTRRELSREAVVLVDEAGQIGGKQMHALLDWIQANEGRVILSGDTRQHGAVEATDALRAIEKYSGLPAIELANT